MQSLETTGALINNSSFVPTMDSAIVPYLVLLDSGVPNHPDTGRKYPLDKGDLIIGSAAESDIQLRPEVVAPRHVRLYCRERYWYLQNLMQTNDVCVDNHVIGVHLLKKDGEAFSIGKAMFAFMLGQGPWSRYHEDAERRSDTDAFLHIANRRAFEKAFRSALSLLIRRGGSLSLIMLDIDFFKKLNTEHGHLGGDAILKQLALVIGKRVREEELFARWGGEEFVVLLPNTTHAQAMTFAERLRLAVEKNMFQVGDQSVSITLSIGVASTEREIALEAFVARANQQMHDAKNQGRNQVMG